LNDDRTRRSGRGRTARQSAPARFGLAGLVACVAAVGLGGAMIWNAAARSGATIVESAAARLETASYSDLNGIAGDAREALSGSPLETRALGVLGIVAERTGRSDEATELMRAAGRLGRRDDGVDAWLYGAAMRNQRYSEAFLHADALMRRNLAELRPFLPPLVSALNDPTAIDPMAERMANKPLWRRQFLDYTSGRSPDLSFALLSAMKRRGSAPTDAELAAHVKGLVDANLYQQAVSHWRAFRPAGQASALLVDGDFNNPSTAPPFGWNLEGNIFGNIERTDQLGRAGEALRIDHDGMSPARFPQQLVVLTPGRYRFSGETYAGTPQSAGRMEWRINCVDGTSVARVRNTDTAGAWKTFAMDFDVPVNCPAQWLELKSVLGEQRVVVEVWYDKLSITPLRVAQAQPT